MKVIRRTALAAISALALTGALALPATASAASASHASHAGPRLDQWFGIYNGQCCILGLQGGGVNQGVLVGNGSDFFENIAQQIVGGHTYYEYRGLQLHRRLPSG
jgi:hypothetical protein